RRLRRPADPESRESGGFEQRVAAISLVEKDAETRPTVGDACCGRERQRLEFADALTRRADPVGDRFELRPMVDGERYQFFRLRPARCRPVDVVDRLVTAERMVGAPMGEEILKL